MEKVNKRDRKYRFFPHSHIRDGQKEIIPKIYEFIRNENDSGMILSGDPGIGKEPCMTSQALLALYDDLFDKIIIIIATDTGKENILKELINVKHNKKIIKLFSKEILCNWIKETEDERISAIEEDKCAYYLCKSQGHRCKYKNNGCKYEIQKDEMENADILICDYNYIISHLIRKFSGFEEIFQNNRILLLINEAHLLKKRAEAILSSSLSSTTIERSIDELDKYEYNEQRHFVLDILESITKETIKNKASLKFGMEKTYEKIGEIALKSYHIQKILGIDNVEDGKVEDGKVEDGKTIGEILISIGEDISNQKFERKEGLVSYTERIGNFIVRFSALNKDSPVFFLKLKELKEKEETSYIGWIPTDVRGYLRNSITLASKYILYSGTIRPVKLRRDVGLAYENIFISEHIDSPYLINRTDIILTKERFNVENLKDKSFSERIKKDLDILLNNLPKPMGIVCTNQCYESLDLSSTYQILDEPENQEDVGDWLDNLFPQAEIIRYTPFGRLAQSIDLKLNSILMLGFPTQKYSPIEEEKIKKIAKTLKGKAGNRWSKAWHLEIRESDYERIIQSIMRGLRNENDKLIVIYFDVLFKKNKPALNSKNLVVCNTIEEVIYHMKNLKNN